MKTWKKIVVVVLSVLLVAALAAPIAYAGGGGGKGGGKGSGHGGGGGGGNGQGQGGGGGNHGGGNGNGGGNSGDTGSSDAGSGSSDSGSSGDSGSDDASSDGGGSDDLEVRGTVDGVPDPCLDPNYTGECGRGDHGRGNPVNGSAHANCHAQHGEVDPECIPPAPTATPEPPGPPPTPTEVPTEVPTVEPTPTSTPTPEDKGGPDEDYPEQTKVVLTGLTLEAPDAIEAYLREVRGQLEGDNGIAHWTNLRPEDEVYLYLRQGEVVDIYFHTGADGWVLLGTVTDSGQGDHMVLDFSSGIPESMDLGGVRWDAVEEAESGVEEAEVVVDEASTDEDITTRTFLKYTVREGDSLWTIAEKFYGNGGDWFRISDANGGIEIIHVGEKLMIPGATQ